MARASLADEPRTMANLLEELGGIDPCRVLLTPPPGLATEKHLIRMNDHTNRLVELVDSALVEKVMGFPEAVLASDLSRLLGNFVAAQDRGLVAGADAAMRLMPGLVRLPDVSFISWDRLPVRGRIPREPIADLVPDLAVEVLSYGNTPKEMRRKLKEYFLAGASLVWFVDPNQRTVRVFTAPDESRTLTEDQVLDGGNVLPGFSLPLRQLFARMAEEPGETPRPRRSPKQSGKRPKKSGPG